MIERLYSSEINPSMHGREVSVAGWVHEIRKLGGIAFVVLRDREGFVQITMPKKEVSRDVFKGLTSLSKESVVVVKGVVRAEPKAPNGYEIIPKEYRLLSRAEQPLPLDPTGKVKANLDTRLDNRFIDLRKHEIMAIFKIRSEVLHFAREFFRSRGFIEVHTPRIISTSSEGGAELFPVAYFEKEAFLAQSPQLYKQMLMATGMDKVFEIATYFRAEEHDTVWHLNEITAIDSEIAFIESEEDVMEVIENLVYYIMKNLSESYEKELKKLGVEIYPQKPPFPRIEYKRALEILEENGYILPYGEDLTTEAEKKLGEVMKDEGYDLYFITKYPIKIKPFYTMPEENGLSRAFDLEFKGREIVSGSQRIHEYELLVKMIKAKGLRVESFENYLKAFRYGMPPHGGFGMGLERFIMQLLNLKNIREAVLFPRDRKRLEP